MSDPAMYNMNQSYIPNWDYPTQYMPQSQYYEQDWNNHYHSSQSQWGYNSPESYGQPPYQKSDSYTRYQDQPMKKNLNYKRV